MRTGELGAAEATQEPDRGSGAPARGCGALRRRQQPGGLGLLTWSEDPGDFVSRVRPVFAEQEIRGLKLRHELTMLGRTYSTRLRARPRVLAPGAPEQTVLNEAWPWAVWYPLRRGGAFERLEPKEKGEILREHAAIGKAYGAADLAHDIRLACHGLDANDNEFVIGLIGTRASSAFARRAGDAPHAPDRGVHRADGSVLRGPRALAQRRG